MIEESKMYLSIPKKDYDLMVKEVESLKTDIIKMVESDSKFIFVSSDFNMLSYFGGRMFSNSSKRIVEFEEVAEAIEAFSKERLIDMHNSLIGDIQKKSKRKWYELW